MTELYKARGVKFSFCGSKSMESAPSIFRGSLILFGIPVALQKSEKFISTYIGWSFSTINTWPDWLACRAKLGFCSKSCWGKNLHCVGSLELEFHQCYQFYSRWLSGPIKLLFFQLPKGCRHCIIHWGRRSSILLRLSGLWGSWGACAIYPLFWLYTRS